MSEGKQFQLGTIGALSLSVVSSVSIVICNKALMSTLGFKFGELKFRITLLYMYMLVDFCSDCAVFYTFEKFWFGTNK